jgi:mono/diheme cytochrome c family protein
MGNLFDVLLQKPLSDDWFQGLIFVSFTLHMLFVLFTLGTGMLAVYFFVDAQWGGKPKGLQLHKRILRTFMAHKSLAAVLGVGPLLLIQVAYAVPFFTAVNLLAPFWLLLFLFLIIAFLCFDILGHAREAHRYLHLAVSIVAILFLLLIPGIFVVILTTAESPGEWLTIAQNGFRLSGGLAGHWLLRYLHVLGGAIVFGSAYHYFFSAKEERENKALLKWITAGILFQLVIGLSLYFSVREKLDLAGQIPLFFGAVIALFLLRSIICGMIRGTMADWKIMVPLLMILLVSMLLTRQAIQDRGILPLQKVLARNAVDHKERLEPHARAALDGYQSSLQVSYHNRETIYMNSCAFCHGKEADGKGVEAQNLTIPPEDIAAIRTTHSYFYEILKKGIDGTAMPPFTFLDRYQVYGVIDYLNRRYHVLSRPEGIPVPVSSSVLAQAQMAYEQNCSSCHGRDGKGTPLSQGLKPAPPNLAEYSLTSERAFAVITNGYPGTAMPPFKDLAEDVRWGLVKVVYLKRRT